MLAAQQGFRDNCSEWVCLGELALVIVPGSVEDERIFSAMNFLKSDLRNRLVNPHLTDALRIFSSHAYTHLPLPRGP